MGYSCFLLEPTGRAWRWLRRYGYSSDTAQRCGNGYGHNATHFLDIISSEQRHVDKRDDVLGLFPASDPRWPASCEKCGAPLEDCEYQIFTLTIYRTVDGREFLIHGDAPSPAPRPPYGAMWYADWMLPHFAGPDGHALVVRCPIDHDWLVDGRASNCTEACVNCGRPYHAHFDGNKDYTTANCEHGYEPRDGGAHRCWVRHGTPPNVTVDKNGLTCSAGAGSIQTPGWHGFLRNGELVE